MSFLLIFILLSSTIRCFVRDRLKLKTLLRGKDETSTVTSVLSQCFSLSLSSHVAFNNL